MFKNKTSEGKLNLCGENVAKIRMSVKPKMSQRALADKLQLAGIDIDKNAVQRIECGKRFVTDIELAALAQTLNTDIYDLLKK